MRRKALTIDEIIAENKTDDNVELKFVINKELVSNYSKFKEYLSNGVMKYKFVIIAEFELENRTYKFYIDRKANAYQLRIYVVDSERYVLNQQYISNLNPKLLTHFQNVIRYTYLMTLNIESNIYLYEPLFWIKTIAKRFYISNDFEAEFSNNILEKYEQVIKEPYILGKGRQHKQLFSINIGKISVEIRPQIFITQPTFIINLFIDNEYYDGDIKLETRKKIQKHIDSGEGFELNKYFSIQFVQNFAYGYKNKNAEKLEFANNKAEEYSKHYSTLDDALSNILKLIEETGEYIEQNRLRRS